MRAFSASTAAIFNGVSPGGGVWGGSGGSGSGVGGLPDTWTNPECTQPVFVPEYWMEYQTAVYSRWGWRAIFAPVTVNEVEGESTSVLDPQGSVRTWRP